jgi:hypothetical protein
MITKKEIVELLNEYGGYVDRSRTEKAIHEDNFELIADAILSKLHQPTVSGRSELLAFANEMQKIGFNEMDDAEKVVDVYMKANSH